MKKVFLFLFFIFLTGCTFFSTDSRDEDKLEETINLINGTANINSYTIYGRFFNITGELEEDVTNLSLVLKNETKEIEYPVIIKEENGKVFFQTTELINQGINLENMVEGEYVLLLKDTNNRETKYYTLKNQTSYNDLEYYTITKNNTNQKIEIGFDYYKNQDFLYVDVVSSKIPNDIYDIVIDPGHGGVDVGANKNGYFESNINLDYAKKVASELTKLGLKVKLTRDKDVSIPNYGEKGRVSIPYQTKAKLMLSIHINSAIHNVGNGGVEIYVPNHADTTFASNLAKNIVDLTSTIYSSNVSNKIGSGVYLRTLSQDDLKKIAKEASKKGYEPYDKATTDSTYYYIIRETGGIVTNAYVDSRNKDKEWNPYYLSNHGTESYLVELGYMNSSTNLKILLEESDGYVEAIVKSVKEYLEI